MKIRVRRRGDDVLREKVDTKPQVCVGMLGMCLGTRSFREEDRGTKRVSAEEK